MHFLSRNSSAGKATIVTNHDTTSSNRFMKFTIDSTDRFKINEDDSYLCSSSVTAKPLFEIKNTNADATGSILRFTKDSLIAHQLMEMY